MKTFTLAVISLLLSGCVAVNQPNGHGTGADDSNTVNSLTAVNPALTTYGSSAYPGQIYNSLSKEDANRWYEQGFGNQVSITANSAACLGTTGGSLTMTPVSCVAYNAGYRGTETGSITFPNNATCWIAMDENTTGSNAGLPNFTRVPSTHYLIDCIDVGIPTMAADSQLLMNVVTSGGARTFVTDKRAVNLVLPAITLANLFISGTLTVASNTVLQGNLSISGTVNLAGGLNTPLSKANGGTGNGVGSVSWLMGNTGGSNAVPTPDAFPVNGSGVNTLVNEKFVSNPAPTAGTISHLNCFVQTAPGASNTWEFALAKNGVTTAIFCTISNGLTTCSDVVDTVAVAAGDRLSTFAGAILGTPTSSPAACSYELQS